MHVAKPKFAKELGRVRRQRERSDASTIVTVFASLQTRIANFTLANMLAEVERWSTAGVSLFQSELDAMKADLPPPEQNPSSS